MPQANIAIGLRNGKMSIEAIHTFPKLIKEIKESD